MDPITMDAKMQKTLRDADDPVNWEMPSDFPWEAEIARIQALRNRFEAVVGHALTLNDNIQDAAHFAELAWHTEPRTHPTQSGRFILTHVAIRFSAFGRLVTVWGNVPESPISETVLAGLTEALIEAEYVPVSLDELDSPYTGSNRCAERIETWWFRYFDFC